MKRTALSTFLVVAFSVQAYCQVLPVLLDSVVQVYVKQNQFNGSVLVAQKDRVLLEKGYGLKDAASQTKADAASLYQYGSVTKQFTAALVMYLQEKGKLSISDKLNKYFPDLPYADSVTIHHLLTHTSGIYNYTRNREFMSSEAVKPGTQEKMLTLFRNQPLEFLPGTKFSYSNSGYMLLGYIVEKASGLPYETLLRKVILEPLGMKTAGFDFAHNTSADRTTGYFVLRGDRAEKAEIVDSSVSYAAGALYGSVRDLYAWHRALQKGRLLSAASWKQVYTPFLSKYGFGWSIDSLFAHPVVQHNGGIFGYTSVIKRLPQDDVVVIVLSNSSSPRVEDLANNLLAAVFQQPLKLPKEKLAIQLPEETLKPYVGEYELASGFGVVIRLTNGALTAAPTGQPEAVLSAESETDFFLVQEDVAIHFVKNNEGLVTGFDLKQGGGGAMRAKKIR